MELLFVHWKIPTILNQGDCFISFFLYLAAENLKVHAESKPGGTIEITAHVDNGNRGSQYIVNSTLPNGVTLQPGSSCYGYKASTRQSVIKIS